MPQWWQLSFHTKQKGNKKLHCPPCPSTTGEQDLQLPQLKQSSPRKTTHRREQPRRSQQRGQHSKHQSKQQSHQTHQAPQTLKGPWFWVNKVKLMKTKCPHLYLLHQLMELLRRHLAQVMANEFHEGSCRGRGLWVDPTYHGLLMDEDGDTYSANCPCCTLKCAVCYEETWFYIFPFILCFHLFEL